MQKVDFFFTPIVFGSRPKKFMDCVVEVVDSYFYLGGSVVYVDRKNAARIVTPVQDGDYEWLKIAVKVTSYFTLVFPAIMLIIKFGLRSYYSFHLIPNYSPERAREDLELELELREDQFKSLCEAMNAAEKKDFETNQKGGNYDKYYRPWVSRYRAADPLPSWKEKGEPSWYGDHAFFMPTTHPRLMIRINHGCQESPSNPRHTDLPDYHKNMVEARRVCQEEGLDLLVIPRGDSSCRTIAFPTEGGVSIPQNRKIYIQERLESVPGYSEEDEKQAYRDLTDETVRQLAVFVIQSGFRVRPRRAPVITEEEGFQGNRRVALVNLQGDGCSVSEKLFRASGKGGCDTQTGRELQKECGLIGYLFSERHIDILLQEARLRGITPPVGCREQRMQEINPSAILPLWQEVT
jgi:hypothetical protein